MKYAQKAYVFFLSLRVQTLFTELAVWARSVKESPCPFVCVCHFFVLVLLSTLVESISVPRMWFIPGFWICTNQPAVHNGEVSRKIIWGLGSGAFSVLKGDNFCLFWCWCYSLHTLRVSVFPMWEICCV